MDLYELLRRVVQTLESGGIPYLVTGSVASMAYGEPRLTNDIDIVVDLGREHIPLILEGFSLPEYYASREMIEAALSRRGQFNIIHPASGLKVGFIVRKNTEFDQSRFARKRRLRPAQDCEADFAAPEDVILKKMEFYREGGSEKHLRDITGILSVSGADLDRSYLDSWVDRQGLREIWDAVLRRMAAQE